MASADYFGEFSRIMPYRIGGSNPHADFVAMMTNGASGDINNLVFTGTRAPRSPFEQIRIVASKTADVAWRAVKKIETTKRNRSSLPANGKSIYPIGNRTNGRSNLLKIFSNAQ